MRFHKILFFVLFFFFSFQAPSQNLDSLHTVINISTGNIKAKALLELSLHHTSKNDSLALLYVNQTLKEITDNNKLRGKAVFHKGMVYRSLKKDGLAVKHLEESVVIFKDIDSVLTAETLYWLLRIHQRKGQFPEALKYAYQELDYRKALKNNNQLIKSILEIGYTYDRMGDYNEAIKWHKKGVKKALENDNKYYLSWGTGLIGIAYDELKMYDSALYYNKKAVNLFKEIDDKHFLRTWYSNISNTYIKLKDYKNAEDYILKSLAVKTDGNKSIALINLGKIYIDTNRFKEAKKILDSAMVSVNQNDQKRFKSEAFFRFHELNKKQKKYKNALEYYVKYKETEDQLLNEKKSEQITEMKVQYNTAEKEKQILIQRAELAEQRLTIQQRNYQLFGLIGLALVLSLIGYLFYSQQKLKNKQLQKENELKDALIKIETQNKLQEQRLRISRDLHDNIGAQLTFIISSIDNLKYGFNIKDEKLTHKLDTISEFTSETIYELRDTIWAMNKDEVSIEDLETRIANYIDKAKNIASKTNFEFKIDKSLDIQNTFSSVKGMNIYRIIQEAIHNSLKYADASKIEIQINKLNSKVIFKVSDNGKGFNIDTVEKGNGLLNIEKRANDIQAHVKIHSKESEGTIITLTV